MKNKSAFTLIEVLIAVMLITVLVEGLLRVGTQERSIVSKAYNKVKIAEKISLIIDSLKVYKEHKKIDFDIYLKDLKISPISKHKLSDLFMYNAFLDEESKNSKNIYEGSDTSIKSIINIYKQTFLNKDGYSISYYRISR